MTGLYAYRLRINYSVHPVAPESNSRRTTREKGVKINSGEQMSTLSG